MKSRGDFWERRAERYLIRAGLRLVSRNYRCRQGEIDLVMRDGEELSFVEVRYRADAQRMSAAETIGHHKQARLIRAARHFLAAHPQWAECPCRFDVIAIEGRLMPRYEWIRNAFEIS